MKKISKNHRHNYQRKGRDNNKLATYYVEKMAFYDDFNDDITNYITDNITNDTDEKHQENKKNLPQTHRHPSDIRHRTTTLSEL